MVSVSDKAGCLLGGRTGLGSLLVTFFMSGSFLASKYTEPSLAHSPQTSIFAPSITALFGGPMILRPQTSQRMTV